MGSLEQVETIGEPPIGPRSYSSYLLIQQVISCTLRGGGAEDRTMVDDEQISSSSQTNHV